MSETISPTALPPALPALRISVLIVTFNQGPALRRAVEALERSQHREEIEIVVVDCGSTDGSSTLDTDFPTVNMMRLPHHMGAVRAMNIGTRTAKADLVLYLSPDVEVAPETVTALADALEAEGETVAAACPVLLDEKGQIVARTYRLPDRATAQSIAKGGAPVSIAPDSAQSSVPVEYASLDALLVRKAFIRSMNYFDQRYGHFWADAELGMQIRQASKKIHLYPAIHALYHPAPDPLSGDSILEIDRAGGAAEFVAKYLGGWFPFRLTLALDALSKFQIGIFAGVLGGTKLDGGQK